MLQKNNKKIGPLNDYIWSEVGVKLLNITAR